MKTERKKVNGVTAPGEQTLNEIINIINKLGRGVTLQELCEITETPKEQLLPQIRQLMAELALVEIKGKYALPKQVGLLIGKISINFRGFGFLIQEDEDVFISADDIGYAMDGDVVSVRLKQKKSRGHSKEGYVADVIFRNTETVIGTVKRNGDKFRLIPKNKKVLHDIKLEDLADAKDGDIVIAKILRYPSKRNKLVVSVLSVLGRAGDANIEVDCAIAEMDIPKVFGKEAMKQAKATPQTVEDINGRADFRNEPVITIDGDYSKDFDDAVSLCKTNGGYILKVHIADVSHYVKAGDALDKEAYLRGNSVYFPGSVIPMLPEQLSNGICSLNEGVDRYALSCIMELDEDGRVLTSEIVKSVIRSKHRMTYSKVNAIFEGDEDLRKEYADIVPMLEEMNKLKDKLLKARIKQGSLEFNIPEAEFALKGGEVVDIYPRRRGESEQLIEEFMLLANKTVCRFMMDNSLPCVYRVHEPPAEDKMEVLSGFVAAFGLRQDKQRVTPKKLQQLLEQIKGEPFEYAVNTVMLRTLQKARYSSQNLHHFGLAFQDYCHFTSPIRRYADLMVHRILSAHLSGKVEEYGDLSVICKHISETEKAAMDAEMRIDDLYKCKYLHGFIGEEYEGTVSGMNNYGFYVMLENTCEGMVRLADIKGDYYVYNERLFRIVGERKGRVFQLGDRVRVAIAAVDEELCRVDMVLVEE